MSDELATLGAETPTPTTPQEQEPTTAPAKKKLLFTRDKIRKTIQVGVVFPKLYPDYEPFGFQFRLKLSGEAEERKQEFVSLSAIEQTAKYDKQVLDEVCDLLTELPTGFGDLKYDGKSAGSSFRTYVETCEDPEGKELLYKIVDGANRLYWQAIMPQEFRISLQDSSS